jgi:hypothetical protein
MMKKMFMAIALGIAVTGVYAQDTKTETNTEATKKKKIFDLGDRPNDHFMVQFGYDGWSASGLTNSNGTKLGPSGFSRHFNIYFMMDKPSKNNPHISIGYGLGLATSNVFFKNVFIDVKSRAAQMPFVDVSQSSTSTPPNKFKKFKLATQYLQIPLELRYVANAENPNKGFKAAVGVKLGYLLKSYTKGKNAVDNSGASIYNSSYIVKEYDKHFFNSTMAAATIRIGLGIISLDGSYQLTTLLKDGAGPSIRPYSIGLTLSGL